MTQLKSILIVVCVLFGAFGCSGSKSGTVDDSMEPALKDFAQFLGALPSDGVKPPKKLAEFLPLEPMAPMSAEFIKDGKLVYFWGSGLKTGGQSIVAHEKGAEASGGWVLLEDGSVKKLTSEQFSAAPKAGKK